jgi:leader peptidase (prepilin peptidase)/N-methyltransferase
VEFLELTFNLRAVFALVLAVTAGFALGVVADRLATRWPEHDEEHPPGRAVDWRTAVTALLGAVALGLLPYRFWGDPLAIGLFGAWFVTLIIGLATDLDQRMLPDELTLPVIPIALVYAVSGLNPLVGTDLMWTLVAAVAIPAVLYLPSIPFGAGAFGIGDVKLLIGIGLMAGAGRAFGGVVVGLLVAGVVLVALLATRQIGRRTYVPFGPFLIIGALWAVLIRA